MATNQNQGFGQNSIVCRGLLKEHFCKTFCQNICSNTEINANIRFSHCKTMEILSCQSNESTWAMTIKNIIYVEANVMNMYAKFQLHPPYNFWGEDFWIFFRKFTLYVAMATNQIQRFGQNSYECRGLLKKHFCKKKNLNICSETAKIPNSIFPTVHIRLEQKTQLFVPPIYMWNMERIGFILLGEVVWKCWRWMTDGRQMPANTISSPMSLWLRWAKNL